MSAQRTIRIVDRSEVSAVVLHAPHAGALVPARDRGSFLVDDRELLDEHARLTDHATDRMVEGVAAASTVVSALSRFVVDVERFEGPDEEMSAVGMGVLYTHGTRRQRIRAIGDADAHRLLAHFRDYGERFADLVSRVLDRHGRAIVIDVHSYPAVALPYELHGADRRPALCIGTDERHTPQELVDAVRGAFTGWETLRDQPFRGTYVPRRFLGDPRVLSVMLEIRRDGYLRDDGAVDEQALRDISHRIARLADSVG